MLEIYQDRFNLSAFYTSGSELGQEKERPTGGSIRAANGMFYIDGNLGEGSIRFLIDTSASHFVLRNSDAGTLKAYSKPAASAMLATAGGPINFDWILIGSRLTAVFWRV